MVLIRSAGVSYVVLIGSAVSHMWCSLDLKCDNIFLVMPIAFGGELPRYIAEEDKRRSHIQCFRTKRQVDNTFIHDLCSRFRHKRESKKIVAIDQPEHLFYV